MLNHAVPGGSRQAPGGSIERGMTQISHDSRLTELEIIVSDQGRTIDELSSAIAQQWQVIDALRKRLEALSERFHAVEENTPARPDNAKPPHW